MSRTEVVGGMGSRGYQSFGALIRTKPPATEATPTSKALSHHKPPNALVRAASPRLEQGERLPTSTPFRDEESAAPDSSALASFPDLERFLRQPTLRSPTEEKHFKIPPRSLRALEAEAESKYPEVWGKLRYDYDDGVLIIHTLPSSAHEGPLSVIQNAFGVWQSSCPDSGLESLGLMDVHSLDWEVSTTFQADFSLGNPSSTSEDWPLIPGLVLECALTQTRENAVEKALKWLTRFGFKVRVAAVLDIQRDGDGSLEAAYWEEWTRFTTEITGEYPYTERHTSTWASQPMAHCDHGEYDHGPEVLIASNNSFTDPPCYFSVTFNNRPQPMRLVADIEKRKRFEVKTGVILKRRVKIFPADSERPEKLSINLSDFANPNSPQLPPFEIDVVALETAIVKNVDRLKRGKSRDNKRKWDQEELHDNEFLNEIQVAKRLKAI